MLPWCLSEFPLHSPTSAISSTSHNHGHGFMCLHCVKLFTLSTQNTCPSQRTNCSGAARFTSYTNVPMTHQRKQKDGLKSFLATGAVLHHFCAWMKSSFGRKRVNSRVLLSHASYKNIACRSRFGWLALSTVNPAGGERDLCHRPIVPINELLPQL